MAAMSQEQKDAMAQGRREARAVRTYLDALERGRRRGPKVTPDKLRDRISSTQDAIDAEKDPQARLELIQQRMDDEQRLEEEKGRDRIDDLEPGFVDVVSSYSERKGITYAAWRELGVPAKVLRAGGVSRSRS